MRYRVTGLVLDEAVVEDAAQLRATLARILGLDTTEILSPVVIKHSLDARRRPARHVWSIELDIPDGAQPHPRPPRGAALRVIDEGALPAARRAQGVFAAAPALGSLPSSFQPVVVGAGPAGLFAALALARLGAPPLVLDRGGTVDERVAKVTRYWEDQELDPECNVLFGEGGASLFSDAKIYTRTRDPQVSAVLKELVESGAPPATLIEARPHIGADRMKDLLRNLRARLTALGVELRYGSRVEGLLRSGSDIVGVVVDGEELRRAPVLMAPGHSARDTFSFLHDAGIPMEAWSTAIGLRVEHPQDFIDRAQYNRSNPRAAGLPAADYHLAFHARDGRGSYSFCMCPGGRSIAVSNLEGHVVTNGMSLSAREGRWASSGLVVQVRPEDYVSFGDPLENPLVGFRYQDEWERRAFELGGGGFRAPAQRVVDFLEGRPASDEVESSYQPGVTPADLRDCLPGIVADGIAQSLAAFGRRLRGFDGPLGVLVGVESRTSCPVRILRDEECRSFGQTGFYPVGEGAGYAGGIVSAAVDGVRAAEFAVRHARARVAAG